MEKIAISSEFVGVERILQLLEDTRQPATFFVLGWIAEKYPSIIKSISDGGHQLASHSHSHQLAYEQSKRQFKDDLKRSIDTIQQISGKKIDTYRAPGFSITSDNLWAFEIMSGLGIANDCSIFPASRAHGGIPSYKVAVPSVLKCGGFRALFASHKHVKNFRLSNCILGRRIFSAPSVLVYQQKILC